MDRKGGRVALVLTGPKKARDNRGAAKHRPDRVQGKSPPSFPKQLPVEPAGVDEPEACADDIVTVVQGDVPDGLFVPGGGAVELPQKSFAQERQKEAAEGQEVHLRRASSVLPLHGNYSDSLASQELLMFLRVGFQHVHLSVVVGYWCSERFPAEVLLGRLWVRSRVRC